MDSGLSTVGYTYDPFGKRLSKTVNGNTIYYFYDNEDIIAEYDSAGNIIASYLHCQGIDEPISMTRNSNTYYYTFDGLGSVSELTDSTGAVTEAYKYDAFGNLQTPPATGNSYTYTSREYDAETGLYFYRARYYEAQVGRFITADPIGFEGGVNFYVYVENNPINYIDPYGLQVLGPLPIPPISLPGSEMYPETVAIPRQGDEGACKNKKCRPCDPLLKTKAGRQDFKPTRPHGKFMGPHTHLFEMHQSPYPECRCFWHKFKPEFIPGIILPPGFIPIREPRGGGPE